MAELIPVLDLMNGQVVRGVAGEREQYRANRSCLLNGSDPIETAEALRSNFEFDDLYIADLDALEAVGSSETIFRALIQGRHSLTVDAGVTSAEEAHRLIEIGVSRVVVPLESLITLDSVSNVVAAIGAEQTVFSLDMKNGIPLGKAAAAMSPQAIAEIVMQMGIQAMIILDLAGVGRSRGVRTTTLCQDLKSLSPTLQIWSGGGVRSIQDLHAIDESRVDGVMIASALHDGHITPADWAEYRSHNR